MPSASYANDAAIFLPAEERLHAIANSIRARRASVSGQQIPALNFF